MSKEKFLEGINLNLLFIAALTSAMVALAIEYVAKPRLEVRKERILQEHRSKQNLIQALQSIHIQSGKLSNKVEGVGDWPSEQRETFENEMERVRADLLDSARKAEKAYIEVGLKLRNKERDALTSYVGLVQGLALSLHGSPVIAEKILTITLPLLSFYLTRRIRFIRRRRFLKFSLKSMEGYSSS